MVTVENERFCHRALRGHRVACGRESGGAADSRASELGALHLGWVAGRCTTAARAGVLDGVSLGSIYGTNVGTVAGARSQIASAAEVLAATVSLNNQAAVNFGGP